MAEDDPLDEDGSDTLAARLGNWRVEFCCTSQKSLNCAKAREERCLRPDFLAIERFANDRIVQKQQGQGYRNEVEEAVIARQEDQDLKGDKTWRP